MRSLGQGGAALTAIADGLRSPGGSCLAFVADYLARVLGVTFAFTAEKLDDNSLRVLSFAGPGEGRMPPDCTLAGTACAEVLERGSALCGAGAARSFPDDPHLERLGVEGFAGRALRDAAGVPVGIVAVMNATALSWSPEADAVLSILALTAELELRSVRSEKKLSRVARQWTATVDTMPDFVAVVGPDFRLLRVNLALARFANCSPKELIGRKCHEVLHGLGQPWADCPHEQAIRTGSSVSTELNDPHIGLPLCVTCTPFHDERGRLVGTVHVARDISEQHRPPRNAKS